MSPQREDVVLDLGYLVGTVVFFALLDALGKALARL